MNRGSLEAAAFATKLAAGFNEAPIHESGKSRPLAIPMRSLAPLQ